MELVLNSNITLDKWTKSYHNNSYFRCIKYELPEPPPYGYIADIFVEINIIDTYLVVGTVYFVSFINKDIERSFGNTIFYDYDLEDLKKEIDEFLLRMGKISVFW